MRDPYPSRRGVHIRGRCGFLVAPSLACCGSDDVIVQLGALGTVCETQKTALYNDSSSRVPPYPIQFFKCCCTAHAIQEDGPRPA